MNSTVNTIELPVIVGADVLTHSRERVQAECETCGAQFLALARDVQRGMGKFCSRSCSSRRIGRRRPTFIPVPLTINQIVVVLPLSSKAYALIDASDFALVGHHKWSLFDCSGKKYGCRVVRNEKGKPVTTLLHRAILQPESTVVVDHISGDGLDCRRVNMRVCSQGQNSANQTEGP